MDGVTKARLIAACCQLSLFSCPPIATVRPAAADRQYQAAECLTELLIALIEHKTQNLFYAELRGCDNKSLSRISHLALYGT